MASYFEVASAPATSMHSPRTHGLLLGLEEQSMDLNPHGKKHMLSTSVATIYICACAVYSNIRTTHDRMAREIRHRTRMIGQSFSPHLDKGQYDDVDPIRRRQSAHNRPHGVRLSLQPAGRIVIRDSTGESSDISIQICRGYIGGQCQIYSKKIGRKAFLWFPSLWPCVQIQRVKHGSSVC
jgi:hypothetical protein